MRYWHGGAPGLKVGDLLEAGQRHYVDDCAICEAKARGENFRLENGAVVDPINRHEDRVYITSERSYARFYASKFPRGDLYVVEPVGVLLDVGSEDPFPTWAVGQARVVSVYDTYVQLSAKERRTLMRKWQRADTGRAWV